METCDVIGWEIRHYGTAELFWEIVEGIVTFLPTGFGFGSLIALCGVGPGIGSKPGQDYVFKARDFDRVGGEILLVLSV
jgi:hypothetical protein